MAGYRQFHTQFWKDEWLIELDPLERYLFCYLFTNDLSSISGIFKLPRRVILNETGLDGAFVDKTMAKFQAAQKIFYKDGVLWVVNMKKYHKNASPRTMTKVISDVNDIPECDVKTAYLYFENTGKYCIDTVSIARSESERLSESRSEKERESGSKDETPPTPPEYPVKPEIALAHEVTGLYPDYSTEAKVVNNVRACHKRLGMPPHDILIVELQAAWKNWCESKTKDGRLYNPANWDWTERAATGFYPKPIQERPKGKKYTGPNGEVSYMEG